MKKVIPVYYWDHFFCNLHFKENGIFDRNTAQSFRTNILEKGASDKAMTLYINFKGAEPSIEPYLKKKGLI